MSAVAIAATPSPRPVRPSPSVVVAETETGAPDGGRERRRGLGPARTQAGAVADHLDGHVADLEAGRPHPRCGLGQQGRAGGAGPLRLRRAEVRSEVAEPRRREQGVARGVRRHVAVGVTLEALRLVGPGEAGEVQRHAVDEPVDVGADADAGELVHATIMPETQSAA